MKATIAQIKIVALALLVLAPLVFVARAHADTIYTTLPSWNGSDYVYPFGRYPATSTYGQTFIAPSDRVLNDFTFYIRPKVGVTISSRAYVYEWSGSMLGGGGGEATGSPLFTSATSYVTTYAGNVFIPVTVNTGGVILTPGDQYVIMLTVSNPSDYNATTGYSYWGAIWEPYGQHVAGNGGGGCVFYNNDGQPGLINTTQWDNWTDLGDLAFTAHFTRSIVNPEPASLLLVGTGLGALGIAARRRRKMSH